MNFCLFSFFLSVKFLFDLKVDNLKEQVMLMEASKQALALQCQRLMSRLSLGVP